MAYLGNSPGNRFVASKAATQFSGDGSTTAFTLEHSVGSDEDILVSVDGVIQEPSVAYAVSNGTTLTFTAAPSNNSGNNIFVYYLFRTVATVDHPSTSSLQATDGTFTSDLTVDTDTLFADATNDKVGINNASPNHELQINGNSTTSSLSLKTSATGNTTSDGLELKVQGDSAAYLYNYENAMLRFGTNGLERVRIDADGHVTMQSQPAFLAQASDVNNMSDNTTIVFGTEIFDQGGDFASNTFTAPVTGRYLLQFRGRVDDLDTAANWVRIEIITSNRTYKSSIIDPGVLASDPEYWSFSQTVLADMDAGDSAYVQFGQSGGAIQADLIGTDSFFSGFLAC